MDENIKEIIVDYFTRRNFPHCPLCASVLLSEVTNYKLRMGFINICTPHRQYSYRYVWAIKDNKSVDIGTEVIARIRGPQYLESTSISFTADALFTRNDNYDEFKRSQDAKIIELYEIARDRDFTKYYNLLSTYDPRTFAVASGLRNSLKLLRVRNYITDLLIGQRKDCCCIEGSAYLYEYVVLNNLHYNIVMGYFNVKHGETKVSYPHIWIEDCSGCKIDIGLDVRKYIHPDFRDYAEYSYSLQPQYDVLRTENDNDMTQKFDLIKSQHFDEYYHCISSEVAANNSDKNEEDVYQLWNAIRNKILSL